MPYYKRKILIYVLPDTKHGMFYSALCLHPKGHQGQLAPRCRALDAMIKKKYHGIQKAVQQFRFKNVEQHLLLGSGANQNLRPSCRRPPTRTFHPPPPRRYSQLDAPALVRVCSPNDGNKSG